MPSKSYQDQDCYGNGPTLGIDNIDVELTAVSKGYGTEFLRRDGESVGWDRKVSAIQRSLAKEIHTRSDNEKQKRYIVGQIKIMQQVYQ